MDEIRLKHEIMISMLEEVIEQFDQLTFDNFDSNFPEIVKSMKEVHALKAHMINQHGIENLLIYEPEVFLMAKQLENKFDNLVRVFSEEENRLERELKSFESQKKLINYKRYQYANQRTF